MRYTIQQAGFVDTEWEVIDSENSCKVIATFVSPMDARLFCAIKNAL